MYSFKSQFRGLNAKCFTITWFFLCCLTTTVVSAKTDSNFEIAPAPPPPHLTISSSASGEVCAGESVVLTANASSYCSNVTKVYKVTDSNINGNCFYTSGQGVIVQNTCGTQSWTIWRAGSDLVLKVFNNGTAQIVGTVYHGGRTGQLNVTLSGHTHSGYTWDKACYQNNISGTRNKYSGFNGTLTTNGHTYTISPKSTNQHFILAQGASWNPGQYGFGAWTGGSLGACTEWFGNLTDITSSYFNNSISYSWSTGQTSKSITVNPTETTTYSVTVTGCDGTRTTKSITVEVEEDSDGDGISDSCDACQYGDDNVDDDNDGVPNGCDLCLAGDDTLDTDGDGIPDACDTEECDLTVNVGEDLEICMDQSVEINAEVSNITDCVGGCTYPILSGEAQNCPGNANHDTFELILWGPTNRFEVTGTSVFEKYEDGTAKIKASFGNANDTLEVSIQLYGGMSSLPNGSQPAMNRCGDTDTDGWYYYQGMSGTITSEQYGVHTIKRKGPPIQMGIGADPVRTIFSLGGWFSLEGDQYYGGDFHLPLGECAPIAPTNDVTYEWTTTDGNIVGATDQATITADKEGTYTVTVTGCDDCSASDSVVVSFEADSDDDGISDSCDICIYGDDNADDDADGVPNDCDICQEGDDNMDSDGDGTPDACDKECSPDFTVDAGQDQEVCAEESVEFTAAVPTIPSCPGGCEYPVLSDIVKCNNGGTYQLNIGGNLFYIESNAVLKRFDDGTAEIKATFTSNDDVIAVDVFLFGGTDQAPAGGAHGNYCGITDFSDWYYYTGVSGTF
ncbi:MAG: PKD domain-containing protein, partial [Flavobacteriaceae bacterium]